MMPWAFVRTVAPYSDQTRGHGGGNDGEFRTAAKCKVAQVVLAGRGASSVRQDIAALELLFAPPAVCECGHSRLARRFIAVGRRTILMVAEGQCPHPRRCSGRRVGLEDAADHCAILHRVKMVGIPSPEGLEGFEEEVHFGSLQPLPDQQPDALVIVQLAFLSLKGKPRRIRTITAGVSALCTPLVACRAALACSAYLLRRVLRCFFARGQSPLQRKAVQHVTKHGIVTLFSGAGVCSGVLFVTLSEGRHGGIHLSAVKPRHDNARFPARKM
jgi:hypothetical protein